MSAATLDNLLLLALSAVLASVSTAEVADDSPHRHGNLDTVSCLLEKGCPFLDPALDCVSDVGEIGHVLSSSGMHFQDFGVQYWGDSFQRAALESAPHGALIIEPSLVGADASPLCREESFLPSEVMAIRLGGTRPVFGYLNVGELASYRDYWVEAFGSACTVSDLSSDSAKVGAAVERDPARPAWYGARDRHGELLSAFWTREWEEILRRRIDALLAMGFDGVFLDDALHYFSWGEEEALARVASERGGPVTIPESARAIMSLIVRLGCYARFKAPDARPSFKLIVNGAPYVGWDASGDATPGDSVGLDLYHRYLNSIDAILVENALSRPDGKGLLEVLHKEYAQRGMSVLTIEVWSRESSEVDFEKFRAIMRERAEENGFRTYVVPDGLFDRFYPPVSEIRASK